ncbi:diguanylate cyclase (GGDEF) domain-containing protein [Kaistia soli DSM 19436]|uniref:diguanylate cyclase n=1 Tax=Kaistia soli DSM 19436 TaxID=1122133 RepID=A0A1M5JFR0_9HYPH|nr:diguanylate cyclase [Kaistia soli]SHG39412.1 diguanylate cyclase (GGDEF) domain-containing protein [Kaistia soli DSM 19436]
MPDPRIASPLQQHSPDLDRPTRRMTIAAEDELAAVPVEQRALVVRLSQEVAALRAALDLSRHRIATLEVEAAVDPVSGLLNRRTFDREVEKAAAFRNRYQTPAVGVLIAIDGLAAVAERHGQQVANRVLGTIGVRLKGVMRSCDVAARIDPYQFALVLWNAAAVDCQPRLDALRAAVGGMDRLLEGRVAAVSARIAAAQIQPDETPDGLITRIETLLGARRRAPRG